METHQRGPQAYIIPLQLAFAALIIFGAGVVFGSQILVSQAQGGTTVLSDEAEDAFAPLFQSYNLIQQQYIDDSDTTALVDAAIHGMVNSLNDQYSNYVEPEFFGYMDANMSGQIEGIGTTIQQNEAGMIEVVNVLPNTPAERAGVKDGDIFYLVDGQDVRGFNTLQLVALVRGPSGTVVEITFLRGEEEVTLTIERAPIEIPNITAELLENDIAYIRMENFTSIARQQVDEAIQSFSQTPVKGMIFDLRDNPGGFLTTATEIAGLFLKEGLILTEEFGDGTSQTFTVRNGQVIERLPSGDENVYSTNAAYYALDYPIIVLVNERSASASELVAGAWQDQGVATILGEITFGKGSVQIQNSLINGGGLRLTVARWLTPNGNSISDKGVTPDIMVEVDESTLEADQDPQLDAAVHYLRTGEIPPQPEQTEVPDTSETDSGD